MDEILPGVWHWTTPNRKIRNTPVSSYWLDGPGVFIDPLIPDAGIAFFEARPLPPQAVVLSNRHHNRDSAMIVERFGCQMFVPDAGLHAFTDGELPVVGYAPGDQLPGDLVPFVIGSLSPDEDGLFLESAAAIWVGDTLVRSPTDHSSRIGWVPDFLMDDPDGTKEGLLRAFSQVLQDYEFVHLMLAHGLPLIGNGRAELEALVREGGRTAPDAF